MKEAGTIESLTYDTVNGFQVAGVATGISFVLTFYLSIRDGKSKEEALKASIIQGLKIGGHAWITSIMISQISRTNLPKVFTPLADFIVEQMGSKGSSFLASTLRWEKN